MFLALLWGVLPSPPCSLLLWRDACFVFCLSREEEDVAVLVTLEKPLRRGLSHESDPNAVAPPRSEAQLRPLSPEKLEEILHEANRLAAQLGSVPCRSGRAQGEGSGPRRGEAQPSAGRPLCSRIVLSETCCPHVSSLARSTPSSPSSLTPDSGAAIGRGPVRSSSGNIWKEALQREEGELRGLGLDVCLQHCA